MGRGIVVTTGERGNPMRARYPEIESFIERDGVKVGYEVFGTGDQTGADTSTTCTASSPPAISPWCRAG